MNFLILLILFFSYNSSAFILIDPDYRLASPENTIIDIADGGCRGNGIDDDELRMAISESINNYWNKVAESRLRMKLGGEVSTDITGTPDRGRILVGCASLGPGVGGITNVYNSRGAARIRLNSDEFTPGSYGYDGLVGTLAHEIGHAVGLHHSGDPASIMTYEDHNWGAKPTYLAQDDKDGVAYLYPNKGYAGGVLGNCTVEASSKYTRKDPLTIVLNIWLEALMFIALIFALKPIGLLLSKK